MSSISYVPADSASIMLDTSTKREINQELDKDMFIQLQIGRAHV